MSSSPELPRLRPRRGERPRDVGAAGGRAAEPFRSAPLRQRPGSGAGQSRSRVAALGCPASVERNPAGDRARGAEGPLAGIGVDTWGVDFGLLNRHGRLIGNPYHYRDGRTDGMLAEAFRRMPRAQIFEPNRHPVPPDQLALPVVVDGDQQPAELAEAETFLPMPSLFSYWLSGRAACEFSIATTTQCYDPRLDGWASALFQGHGHAAGHLP